MIDIRKAKLSDIDEIIKLGNTVSEFQVGDETVTFWPKHIIQNVVKSRSDFILVATDQRQIIGFVIANFNPVFQKAIIENIFVKPDYRGQKISDQLRGSLLKKLKKNDCEYVCTLVNAKSISAIKSYQKYGFNRGINCVWLDYPIGDSFKTAPPSS